MCRPPYDWQTSARQIPHLAVSFANCVNWHRSRINEFYSWLLLLLLLHIDIHSIRFSNNNYNERVCLRTETEYHSVRFNTLELIFFLMVFFGIFNSIEVETVLATLKTFLDAGFVIHRWQFPLSEFFSIFPVKWYIFNAHDKYHRSIV